MECATILDLLIHLDLANPGDIEKLNKLLERIVAMLSRLCLSELGDRGRSGARAGSG